MKSIIVGGGKIGYYLLRSLYEKNFDVVLIENDTETCQKIADEIDADVIFGDGTDLDVLYDAGIEDAEVIAAVTGNDEENLVICEIAKTSFNVSKTIARVNNPKNISMFKALGVDKIVCSTEVITNLIEFEFGKGKIKIVKTIERGSMIVAEITIESKDSWCEQLIKDIEMPEECVLTSILRDGKAIYPKGNVRILEGDNILLLTSDPGLSELKKQFQSGGNKNAWLKK